MALYEYCPDPFDDFDESDPSCGDDDGDYRPSAPKTKPTCKRCGKTNLIWAEDFKGWRLYENYDVLHVCQIAATPDDFGDVE